MKYLQLIYCYLGSDIGSKACYIVQAVEGGMPIEAMVDLTGGLAERYELNNHK